MRNFELCIISECYVDTFLIETLVKPQGGKYNHHQGCTEVGKEMKKKSFAVGVIDKDKGSLPYLKEFDLVASAENLFLYRHKQYPSPQHYIIVVGPAAEKWILGACSELEISLVSVGIIEDMEKYAKLEKLKSITKHQKSLKQAKAELGPLFHEMRRKGAATPGCAVHTLMHWITTLRDKNYAVTKADLLC